MQTQTHRQRLRQRLRHTCDEYAIPQCIVRNTHSSAAAIKKANTHTHTHKHTHTHFCCGMPMRNASVVLAASGSKANSCKATGIKATCGCDDTSNKQEKEDHTHARTSPPALTSRPPPPPIPLQTPLSAAICPRCPSYELQWKARSGGRQGRTFRAASVFTWQVGAASSAPPNCAATGRWTHD